jgi:hypothetical protein
VLTYYDGSFTKALQAVYPAIGLKIESFGRAPRIVPPLDLLAEFTNVHLLSLSSPLSSLFFFFFFFLFICSQLLDLSR